MSGGPLSAVLRAFEDGAGSLDEIARTTGMGAEVVQTSVDHLRRMGRIEAKELSMGCPSGGCGSCASGTADGDAGCGSSGPSTERRGPVLVQLSLRR
ncbi:MAG: FeoC-like transcriptional regulator [Luteococcus sp.]|uniref:FeoC-like transcriptional regulator n=1 Tax=Luteococcus sp. TaxID=1969402 RepID=UPI0026487E01|nr:FeoC-like transcriptional regulator [Luteococcus sp.]MDN5564798.1 FeoC-like transcriptional regulator [Luteococcus sp.]